MPNIRHAFVSAKTDSLDTTLVRPVDWNAPLVYTDENGDPSSTNAAVRETLTANTTYYVATTGSDVTGDGSLDTPWATLQYAVDTIVSTVDFAGYRATVQLSAGTYTAGTFSAGETAFASGVAILVLAEQWVGGGELFIIGDETTPANVVFDCTGGAGIVSEAGNVGHFFVSGFQFTNLAAGGTSAIRALAEGAEIYVGDVNIVGAGNGETLFYASDGGLVFIYDRDIRVSGTIASLIRSNSAKVHCELNRITLVSTPTFSSSGVEAFFHGTVIWSGNTITGSATGARFGTHTGGLIAAVDSGGNYLDVDDLPGSTAGDVSYGGEYNNIRLDLVNPYSFGAIGDGVTNDAVALQAWLDCGAPVLYLPHATFATTADLTPGDDTVKIFGEGTLLWTGANGTGTVLDLTGCNDLTVEDITVSKPWTGTPASGVGIYVNSDHIRLKNIYMPHGGRFGIYLEEGTTDNFIDDCVVADCYSNLIAAYSNSQSVDVTIRRTQLYHNLTAVHHALVISGGGSGTPSNNLRVEDCYTEMIGSSAGAVASGFFIANLAPGSGVVGCRFFNMGPDAIELQGFSQGFVIKNNEYFSEQGLDVGFGVSPGVGETCTDGFITGNKITGNGGQGLAIGYHGTCSGMVVSNNIVRNPCQAFASSGIALLNSTNCIVENNDVNDDGTGFGMNYGVHEVTGPETSSTNHFRNNTVRGATIADYYVSEPTSKVTGVPEIIKLTDETITSDNTLSDDSTLKFNVAADQAFKFKFKVWYHSATTPDFKYTVTGPAGGGAIMQTRAVKPDLVEVLTQETAFNFGPNSLTVAAGTEGYLEIDGICNTVIAGTITFQWAQNTSDPGGTTVYRGSTVDYVQWGK